MAKPLSQQPSPITLGRVRRGHRRLGRDQLRSGIIVALAEELF